MTSVSAYDVQVQEKAGYCHCHCNIQPSSVMFHASVQPSEIGSALTGVLRAMIPVASLPALGQPLNIEIDDWDLLLHAVEIRLRQSVCDKPIDSEVLASDPALFAKIQRIVLECVSALEKLHTALAQERSCRNTSES